MQVSVRGKEERGRVVVRKRENPGLARILRPQNCTGFCSVGIEGVLEFMHLYLSSQVHYSTINT